MQLSVIVVVYKLKWMHLAGQQCSVCAQLDPHLNLIFNGNNIITTLTLFTLSSAPNPRNLKTPDICRNHDPTATAGEPGLKGSLSLLLTHAPDHDISTEQTYNIFLREPSFVTLDPDICNDTDVARF